MKDLDAKNSKYAFLIIAHGEPKVLRTLLDCIDDQRNDVFILIDKKSRCSEIRGLTARKSKVVYVPELKIYWGDVSQVEAELRLFEYASNVGEYAYYHLISGVDLPLLSPDEMHRRLNGRNECFIAADNPRFESGDPEIVNRVRYYRPFLRLSRILHGHGSMVMTKIDEKVLIPLQKLIGVNRVRGFKVCKGCNWASLTLEAVRYLVDRKKLILARYAMTSCPDEIYKQTELWNSSIRQKLYMGEDRRGASLREIDWNRGSPYVWRSEDIERLSKSDALFARKVTSRDEGLLAWFRQRCEC